MGHPKLKKEASSELARRVARAKAGDQESLAWLISDTKERLIRFLFFLCGDTALAKDLCQDTYVYALEHLMQLKEPEAFARWLFLIAKNQFYDHKKSPRNKPHDSIDQQREVNGVGAEPALWLEVREVLLLLDPAERAVLLLVDLEGNSYAETAEALNISESAVTSRLYRARAAFCKIYFKG